MDDNRTIAQARWLDLTRTTLPALAPARGWPVFADHCFQRILLDAACGGVWYDHIARRPAYAYADRDILDRAIALAEAAVSGDLDLFALDRQSLAWRRRR